MNNTAAARATLYFKARRAGFCAIESWCKATGQTGFARVSRKPPPDYAHMDGARAGRLIRHAAVLARMDRRDAERPATRLAA